MASRVDDQDATMHDLDAGSSASRISRPTQDKQRSSSPASPAAHHQRSGASSVAADAPSRLRRRTFGNDDLQAEQSPLKKRVSIHRTPVPAIPSRFLANSHAHSRSLHNTTASQGYNTANPQYTSKGHMPSSPLAYHYFDAASARSPSPSRPTTRRPFLFSAPRNDGVVPDACPPTSLPTPASHPSRASHARGTSLPTFNSNNTNHPAQDEAALAALTGQPPPADMDRAQADGNEDLFMQLAEDNTDGEPTITQRAASRSSWQHDKRYQPTSPSFAPTPANGHPRTTGPAANRPSSRFTTHIDTSRANNGFKTPAPGLGASFTSPRYESSASANAHMRTGSRYSAAIDCSPRTTSVRYNDHVQSPEKSPELPTFGRRRPSFGYPSTSSSHGHRQGGQSVKPQDSEGDSPGNSSEAKQSAAESDSVDSQTAPSTVWDELDDLKSRIKKLELTGKLPSTSSAAVTGGAASSERPRTATTAPTTINSSPKQERKAKSEFRTGAETSKSPPPAPLSLEDIHPTLHAALTKAKALLSASLYRSLEATATDALQLAAMTGSAGPQGTTFSAASIINGVTVSDRHIRRKADLMCRNLTDLCLALCEGKQETPSIMSSPIGIETPPRSVGPRTKQSRTSLAYGEDLSKIGNRPMSRLDARRSSILGLHPSNSMLSSPQASGDDISVSEQETTPSQPQRGLESRRQSRLSNRLVAPRFGQHEETSGDDDSAIRPPSRAMTDVGNRRSSQHHSPREYTMATSKFSFRSPGLRDSMNARRANADANENNREISRVASLNLDGSRRRFARESTPPVLEEEMNEQDSHSQSQRRIFSNGNLGHQYSSRRAMNIVNRSSSLSQRRQNVMVE
ncbi:hypothetical protein Q7P37_004672 [Cladosporium fusiforme]